MRISDWSSDVCSSDLGREQFDAVMSAVRSSPELLELGVDGRGEDRFTSRGMIDTEQRLQRAADRLAGFHQANVPATSRQGRLDAAGTAGRSEEHTSELQSLMRISYAVFCLKKKKKT